jgi:SOS-response transcriptional repressor LexA
MWMSKSNRKRESNDVKSILGENGQIRLPLFIKKNNDEGQDFYYMGEVSPELNQTEQTSMKSDSGKMVSVVKILFNLKEAVSDALYNYLTESNVVEKNKTKSIAITDGQQPVEDVIRIESTNHFIPLYDFYAAAGAFSEMQSEKDYTLIDAPERYSGADYFACKIKGESMNRVIPNGSTCLFKLYTGGSRNGNIMLVENNDYQDPDFNSAFTVKTYTSEKIATDDGSYGHTSVVLRPNSLDDSYEDIVLNEFSAAGMRTVGEFIMVLDSNS